jgi:hypothetical protein
LFGGHIGGRANTKIVFGNFSFNSGNSKIRDSSFTVLINDDVRGFEIPMQYSFVVNCRKSNAKCSQRVETSSAVSRCLVSSDSFGWFIDFCFQSS